MKLYPAQSECPYCHTVYRYSDLRKLKNAKTKECYHCKKTFQISKRSVWSLAAGILIIYSIINGVAIGLMNTINIFPLFIMNLIPAFAALLLYPYYLEFKKSDKKDIKCKKRKK